MVNTMTNDRAIAMLKCAYLAFFIIAGLCLVLGADAFFEVIRPYPFIVTIIAPLPLIICFGLTPWLMERALKKRMGADAFKAWRESPRVQTAIWACVIVIFALLFPWQKVAIMAPIAITLFWLVPVLLKKRMGADAFAKFHSKYHKAVFLVVLVAAIALDF